MDDADADSWLERCARARFPGIRHLRRGLGMGSLS